MMGEGGKAKMMEIDVAGAAQKGGPQLAETSLVAAQLVPRQGHDFRRDRRGFQQQGKTNHEKIVRLS